MFFFDTTLIDRVFVLIKGEEGSAKQHAQNLANLEKSENRKTLTGGICR